VNVVHHQIRPRENRMVDPLQDIPHIRPRLIAPHLVSVIDVPIPARSMTNIVSWHEKLAGKPLDVVIPSGGHDMYSEKQ
jgi:hypothetical protein